MPLFESLDPFISRADLGEKLGRDLSSDDFALACVDAACDICRNTAEQSFNEVVGGSVNLDGSGTDVLLLPELPVNGAGTVIQGGTTLTEGTDYHTDWRGMLFRGSAGGGYASWTRGRRNVTVIYDHGFTIADFPRDVRMVALTTAARLFSQGVGTFESLGDRSIRYDGTSTDMPLGEQRILRKYRPTRSR